MVRCLELSIAIFIYLNTNEKGIKSIVPFSLLSLVLSLFLSCTRIFAFSAGCGTISESSMPNFLQSQEGCTEGASTPYIHGFPLLLFHLDFRALPNLIC